MSGMSVEMILKLVDQATGPLRNVESELGRLQQQADRLNKQRLSGGVKASDWFENQKQIKATTEALRAQEAQMAKMNAAQSAAGYAFAAVVAERAGTAMVRGQEKALELAREHQKIVQSIATAGGLIGGEGKISGGILSASRNSGVKWEEIARGERELVALGGGDFVERLAPVRERLARLAKASEADPEHLYNMMFHYMELNKLNAQQAITALEVNYAQGKKGAYELKNMAMGLPKLEGLGLSYGLTGEQAARDLPAVLQMFRKVTGSPGEADTRLRHIMTKLTDPNEAKRIEKELGVDVYKVRAEAMKKGAEPLFAVLNALTDKIQGLGGKAGKVDEASGQVIGGDVKKLGAIARDYYFRSGLDAWRQMREQLKEFMPSDAEAEKIASESYAANNSTAAAAHERAANAWNMAMIKAATPWMELDKKVAAYTENAGNIAGDFAEKHAGAVAAGTAGATMGMWALAGIVARKAIEKAGAVFAGGMAGTPATAAVGGGLVSAVVKGGLAGVVMKGLWDYRDEIHGYLAGISPELARAEREKIHKEIFHERGRFLMPWEKAPTEEPQQHEPFSASWKRMEQMHHAFPDFLHTQIGRKNGQNTYGDMGPHLRGPRAPMSIGYGGETKHRPLSSI